MNEHIQEWSRMHANIVTLRCFSDPSARRPHEKIHTGEKPFKCKHCDKLFNRQTDCKRHGKTHTRDRTRRCTIARWCGNTPIVRCVRIVIGALANHNNAGNANEFKEKKPYPCKDCKNCSELSTLQEHGHYLQPWPSRTCQRCVAALCTRKRY